LSSLYQKSNAWKFVLMILGAAILLFTILYSNFLADNLKKKEEKHLFLYKLAINELIGASLDEDVTFYQTIMDSFPLPVIYEDESGMLVGINFSIPENNNPEFLESKKKDFLKSGEKPIEYEGYAKYIYWFNSPMLKYIQMFPYVQGLLVSLYIGLGYFLFSSSRRSEQNRVWAGMAKETAHQLGTPISAIIGWIEILKDNYADKPDDIEIIKELKNDVDRLELVADRFSKIGSEPVLKEVDIFSELQEVKEYLQRRSPKRVQFNFIQPKDVINVHLNQHLFAWVIENLIRNSLDAMDGKGTIGCGVYQKEDKVYIELSDTGHGIPSAKFKSVFKPGYSTKKRGWGLGLSLAKRIIEEYHKGKIFVKSSKPNEETIFVIILPIIKNEKFQEK
jgi:hypothetical protein